MNNLWSGNLNIADGVAELLEMRSLWRPAARRWLIVMDESPDEGARERKLSGESTL
ncbi:PerC family transcriptional regulator [Pantoea agglomerans]|uniref:PerC family transcriptional regulator n=1 Tax=Enterobacter agglomerans TaxID=549 RepID=UPI003AAFF32D